jgi:hypothetical protein
MNFQAMKPSMWMICHGYNSQSFHTLVAATYVNNTLTDPRNSKRRRDQSATSMEILVSGENHKVSNAVFSICRAECLASVQDTATSLFHCSPYPLLLQKQPSPVGLSYHCLMQPSGSQCLHKSCSLSLMVCSNIQKPTARFFFCSVAI